MKNKARLTTVLTALVIVVTGLTTWFIVHRKQVVLSGQLNAQIGKSSVDNGYYDMRIVAYDSKTGQLLRVNDYADVNVENGVYAVPYNVPRDASTDTLYYQLCRSNIATQTPDGLDSSKLPQLCNSNSQPGSSLPVVECPKKLVISSNGVLGGSNSYSTPNCIDETEESVTVNFASSNTEKTAVAAVFGERGPAGPKGDKGENGTNGVNGLDGAQGVAGDPASDNQTLTFGGSSVLSISGGNGVSLASLLDNTDTLLTLSCTAGQVAQWSGTVWQCASAAVDTDTQDLSLSSNTLSLVDGGSVSLAGYLDNTDAQAISIGSNILSITGNASTVNLAPYLDNTDSQSLSLASNTLSLVSGGSVSLASYLDNTDAQDLSLAGSTLSLTGDGTSVNLAGFLDNTDAQTLSLSSNTLSITGGNSLSLASYLDNTDNQNLFLTVNTPDAGNPSADTATDTLTLANGSGVSITSSGATDTITIAATLGTDITSSEIVDGTITGADVASGTIGNSNLANSSLTVTAGTGISGGGAVSLGGTVTLNATLGTTVDSSEIVDGTITSTDISNGTIVFADIAQNSCATNDIFKWNGSAWACAADIDTDTDTQDLSLASDILSLVAGGSVSLAPYLDNTDAQAISLSSNVISITGNAGTINLAPYLDNTDSQTLSLGGNTLSLVGGGSVSLASYLDNTDSQDLTLVGNTLALTGDGTSVSLASYLDNTDNQNLFLTVNTPDAGNPSADTATDTLTLANGSGVSITSSGATDTITIAATLGTDITSSEIVDGTITGADVASSTIANANLVNSSVTVTAGTGLTGGGSVSLGGTVTINLANDFGSSIDSSEITDGTVATTDITNGTILFADLSQNSCGTNDIIKWNGSAWACAADATGGTVNSFETITTTSGTSPVADSSTDTLTLTAGSGVTVTGSAGTDTITLAAVLGTNIDSSEIVDGTIVDADIAGATITGAKIAGTTVTGSNIASSTVTNSNLVNSSLTVTAGTGLTGGGSVALGGTVTLNLANDFGASIDSSEITNGTIVAADVAGNIFLEIGRASAQSDTSTNSTIFFNKTTSGNLAQLQQGAVDKFVISNAGLITTASVNSTSIVDGTVALSDLASDSVNSSKVVDGSIANADLVNSSLTVTASTGLSGGGAVSLGGTVTLSSTLGTTIDSSEIVDGSIVSADLSGTAGITNAQLANSAVTVTAGSGLINGGSVSLGGTTTVNIGAGNGITVNADDIAVRAAASADALSSTTSSGSGLEVLATGVTLLQGCANNEILKWNEASDVWACASDSGLTSEVDGVIGNEVTDATASGGLTRSGSGTGGSPYTLGIAAASVTNAMLTNSALTVTAGTGLTGGGSVSLGGTVTLNSALGTDIDSSEIVNATIVAADVASNIFVEIGRATAQTDGSTNSTIFVNKSSTGNLVQLQQSTTDRFVVSNAGIVTTASVNSSSIVDGTVVLADLASDSVNSSKVVDGSIANADLANSSITITSGSGLINGSSVSLGGTVTLDVGAGAGITVNANDIAITADGINYTEFSDSLSLDATTTTTLGANNLVTNLDSTGDFLIQDAGTTFLTIDDARNYTYTLDATNNPGYTITNAGSSNVNTNLSGTGDFTIQDNGTAVLTVLDNGTFLFKNSANSTTSFSVQNATATNLFVIDTTNSRAYIGDPTADATGALLVLDTKNTAGDPTGVNGATYYNSSLGKFRCFESGYWQDCGANTTRTTYYYDNEMMSITSDDTVSSQVAGAAAANSVAAVVGEPGRPGVVQQQTGTTATGRAGMLFQNASTIVLGNNTEWVYDSGVRIPTLSTGVQTFTYRAGFMDLNTGDPTDGCFFRYTDAVNAGKWQGVCRNNSTETTCDTTIAAVAATWVRLSVVVNAAGTSADFQTNGASRCQVATNIPITTARASAFGSNLVKSVGATSSTTDVDYIEVQARFTASR